MAFVPSIVPGGDGTIHIVEEDFGPIGRAFRETDAGRADRATVVDDLLRGEYRRPVRVVAFNLSEGWARDVSHAIAAEVRRRADLEGLELPASVESFVDGHTPAGRQLSLRLAERR